MVACRACWAQRKEEAVDAFAFSRWARLPASPPSDAHSLRALHLSSPYCVKLRVRRILALMTSAKRRRAFPVCASDASPSLASPASPHGQHERGGGILFWMYACGAGGALTQRHQRLFRDKRRRRHDGTFRRRHRWAYWVNDILTVGAEGLLSATSTSRTGAITASVLYGAAYTVTCGAGRTLSATCQATP